MTADTADTEPDRRDRSTAAGVGVLAPMQSVSVEQSPTSPVETVLLVCLLAVGAVLTYQAYRGARRNDDRSMALFAVGLSLLTVGHATLKLAVEFLLPVVFAGSRVAVLAVGGASQVVDVVGLVVVFYAILR